MELARPASWLSYSVMTLTWFVQMLRKKRETTAAVLSTSRSKKIERSQRTSTVLLSNRTEEHEEEGKSKSKSKSRKRPADPMRFCPGRDSTPSLLPRLQQLERRLLGGAVVIFRSRAFT
eukprot:scaffold394_cov237-Pinguiococcus_pyrenoidosus.AAC.1